MNKAMLIILDGWGLGDGSSSDGIAQANTPIFDQLMTEKPNCTLKTYGEHVGLPSGQMGNSEVGHLNIGAGRIVHQDLARINKEIEANKVKSNAVLKAAITHAEEHRSSIHLMGLLSHGGVHSTQSHLHHLVDILETAKCSDIFIHAFSDGRDVDPKSVCQNLMELDEHLSNKKTKVGSLIGRFYAMDRDNRWERIQMAYDLLVNRIGNPTDDFVEYTKSQYSRGITDEFIEGAFHSEIDARIKPNDVVICFNYRTDRCREITMALTQRSFPEYNMTSIPLHYVTMTQYDARFENVNVLYDKANIKNTLGEVISRFDGSQLRIAETEKYPHVTFFFSGGREQPFKNELREVLPSPKVATYDLKPEMSAYEVASTCMQRMTVAQPDFICLNFANPDMVGHTGIESAIKQALEVVDQLLGKVLSEAEKHGYKTLIIADHGNADVTRNPDGSPHTAHTTNLVPCILVGKNSPLIDGILADVAPTILELMGIDKPTEMTGKSLLK